MKKLSIMILSAALALSLASCSGDPQEPLVKPVDPAPGTIEAGDDGYNELPEAPIYSEASGEGYIFEYDPEYLQKDPEAETWTYTGDSALPIYISIQRYPELTPKDVIDGILLQSGLDGQAESVYFGSEGVEGLTVSVEGVTQLQRFYALPYLSGTLLVETGSFDGAPERADAALYNAIASFSVIG